MRPGDSPTEQRCEFNGVLGQGGGQAEQGSTLIRWGPLGTSWLPQAKPRSWALPPFHLPAPVSSFPGQPL